MSKGINMVKSHFPVFVIQKHAATHLHYDFRLEVNGVLKSWAIPKEPSVIIGEKRLAILTEDHALSYATFEGIIPEGHYGAGAVTIWDSGSYVNLNRHAGKQLSMTEACKRGKIEIALHGATLRGPYVLVKFGDDPKHSAII